MGVTTNTAAKGHRKEYQARKELEADGWFIVFKSIRNRFGCIDLANLFDIAAYKNQARKYISCKHFNGYYLPHQKEITDFKAIYGKEGESYELWIWKEGAWVKKDNKKIYEKPHWIKIIL